MFWRPEILPSSSSSWSSFIHLRLQWSWYSPVRGFWARGLSQPFLIHKAVTKTRNKSKFYSQHRYFVNEWLCCLAQAYITEMFRSKGLKINVSTDTFFLWFSKCFGFSISLCLVTQILCNNHSHIAVGVSPSGLVVSVSESSLSGQSSTAARLVWRPFGSFTQDDCGFRSWREANKAFFRSS